MKKTDTVSISMKIATTKNQNKNCRKYNFTHLSVVDKAHILDGMKGLSVNHCIREDEGKEYQK